MNWNDFKTAFDDAKNTVRQADSVVADMARMVAGRLKNSNVSHYVLEELKKELADYNLHTKEWKQ